MLRESEKIKKAIERIADNEINKLTAPCFRVYKAVVTQAPNGTTCKVRLVGDNTILTLPYARKLGGITIGTYVWVGAFYAVDNSLSNAIVWDALNFDVDSVSPASNIEYAYNAQLNPTNGVISVPVDTTTYRITLLALVNNDSNAGTIGYANVFVWGGVADQSVLANNPSVVTITPGSTITQIDIANGDTTSIWYTSTAVNVSLIYSPI